MEQGLTLSKLLWAVLFVWVFSVCVNGSQALAESQGVVIDRLLPQIQRALIRVQDEADVANLPKLTSVRLELSTFLKKGADGKIRFFVFSLGGGGSQETSQNITLTLSPPAPGAPSPVGVDYLADALANSILSAARSVHEARTRKPPLILTELKATIKFVVTKIGGGGAEFEVGPIGFELSGEVKSTEIQTITVTFK